MLHVEAREYSTRKEVKATLATRYTPEELRQQLKVATDAARAAEERRGADLQGARGPLLGLPQEGGGHGLSPLWLPRERCW